MTHASFQPTLRQVLSSLQPPSGGAAIPGQTSSAGTAPDESAGGSFAGWLSQLEAAAPSVPAQAPAGTSTSDAPVPVAMNAEQSLPREDETGASGSPAIKPSKVGPKMGAAAKALSKDRVAPTRDLALAPSPIPVATLAAPQFVPSPPLPGNPSIATKPEPVPVAEVQQNATLTSPAGPASLLPAIHPASNLQVSSSSETAAVELESPAPAPPKGALGTALPFAALVPAPPSFASPAEAAHSAGTRSVTAAPAPSQQVAPALAQLSHSASGGQMTLRLNPGELGHVQVQIERAADGTASVHITAERPETLQLLVADQAQLHRTLDSAGVPHEGRTLSLALGNPELGGDSSGAAAGGSSGSFGDAQSGGQQNRPSSGGRSGTDPATSASTMSTSSLSDSATINAPATGPVWLRAGVDITA